jgi:hypothetical protein
LARKALAASTGGVDAMEPSEPADPVASPATPDAVALGEGPALAAGLAEAGGDAAGDPPGDPEPDGLADVPQAAMVVTRTSPATAVPNRWSVGVASI